MFTRTHFTYTALRISAITDIIKALPAKNPGKQTVDSSVLLLEELYARISKRVSQKAKLYPELCQDFIVVADFVGNHIKKASPEAVALTKEMIETEDYKVCSKAVADFLTNHYAKEKAEAEKKQQEEEQKVQELQAEAPKPEPVEPEKQEPEVVTTQEKEPQESATPSSTEETPVVSNATESNSNITEIMETIYKTMTDNGITTATLVSFLVSKSAE